MASSTVPAGEHVPTADQRIVGSFLGRPTALQAVREFLEALRTRGVASRSRPRSRRRRTR